MKRDLRLDDDVRAALERATFEDGDLMVLPPLDKKLYRRVDDALGALGGVWSRRRRGHVFANGDPRVKVEGAAATGRVAHPNPHDFFRSSREVAERVRFKLCMGDRWRRTLEPSGGEGDLVLPLVEWFGLPATTQLEIVEVDPARVAVLGERGLGEYVTEGDFLAVDARHYRPFERVLGNPPFERGSDAKHVLHMLDFLAPGGRVVSVVGGSFDRDDRAGRAVRERVEAWGGDLEVDPLPDGSFKHAGTSIRTSVVTIDRPGAS